MIKNNTGTSDRLLPKPPRWSWVWCIILAITLFPIFANFHPFKSEDQQSTIDPTVENFLYSVIMSIMFYGFYHLLRRNWYLGKVQRAIRPKSSIDLFISHSSDDKVLVQSIINLLEAAFENIKIRCSSIGGYGFELGENIDNSILKEVYESRCFVVVISPASLKSVYVLFEIGARWGAGLHFIPLLSGGASGADLEGPMVGYSAADTKSPKQIHQFLKTVGESLHIKPKASNNYAPHIEEIVNLSAAENLKGHKAA